MSQFHQQSFSRSDITLSLNLFRIGFAGTPPTMVYGGTSFVTTARDPIIAPSPIVTPASIIDSYPIHTSLPIIISPLLSYAFEIDLTSVLSSHSSKKIGKGYVERLFMAWFAALNINLAPQAIEQNLPIFNLSWLHSG